MIKFNSKAGPLEVPSSYLEVTIEQLNFFRENADNPFAVFQNLTEIDNENLMLLDLTSVVPFLGFLKEPLLEIDPADAIMLDGKVYELPDIEVCQWAQKIIAEDFLAEGDHYSMLSTYLEPLISGKRFRDKNIEDINKHYQQMDVYSVWSGIRFIYDQLKEVIDHEQKMLKPNITPEMIEAGIKNFNDLGVFNTIDMVAQGKPWRYDSVLRMEYAMIFNKLLKSKISGNFERKYAEIMARKK